MRNSIMVLTASALGIVSLTMLVGLVNQNIVSATEKSLTRMYTPELSPSSYNFNF